MTGGNVTRCDGCEVPTGVDCPGTVHRRYCDHRCREAETGVRYWSDRILARVESVAIPPGVSADSTGMRPRVGILGPVCFHGGAEEWTRLLAASLPRDRVILAGIGIRRPPGDLSPMLAGYRETGVPVYMGESGCRALISRSDVVISWGIPDLCEWMPTDRPRVISVSHTDTMSEWDRSTQEQPCIDRWAAVSTCALGCIPDRSRGLAVVIPNAIDPLRLEITRSAADVRSELGITEDAPIAGYIGRMDPDQKDPMALVRALPGLPTGWRAVLVGGDHDHHAMRDEAARLVGDRAIFAGPHRDIGNYLQVFNCLIVPSRWESFGLSAAEGWSFGVPVLMTPVGLGAEFPDLVRRIGIDDPGPWVADAILADVDDPDRPDRVRRAREHARSRYMPKEFGDRWADLIASVLPVRPDSNARDPVGSHRRLPTGSAKGG